jgi:hypothetical protein
MCSLALLDAVDLSLDLVLAASHLHEHHIFVLVGANSSHTAGSIPLDTVADNIIGGVRAFSFFDEHKSRLGVTHNFDAVSGVLVVLLTCGRCKELDKSVGRA